MPDTEPSFYILCPSPMELPTVTRYHSYYKQQEFIAHSSGGSKSKIRVSAWSGEGPVPGCRPLACCVLTWGAGELCEVSFIRH